MEVTRLTGEYAGQGPGKGRAARRGRCSLFSFSERRFLKRPGFLKKPGSLKKRVPKGCLEAVCMRFLIVSDHGVSSGKIRQALIRQGEDCPLSNLSTLDLAVQRTAESDAEIVFLVLSPNPEKAVGLLQQVRRTVKGRI